MPSTLRLSPALLLMLAACAANETQPVAVSCPPPPPAPTVLLEPMDTEPSMSERIETLLQDFERRVIEARKLP